LDSRLANLIILKSQFKRRNHLKEVANKSQVLNSQTIVVNLSSPREEVYDSEDSVTAAKNIELARIIKSLDTTSVVSVVLALLRSSTSIKTESINYSTSCPSNYFSDFSCFKITSLRKSPSLKIT
jgi:hypothetical protein